MWSAIAGHDWINMYGMEFEKDATNIIFGVS